MRQGLQPARSVATKTQVIALATIGGVLATAILAFLVLSSSGTDTASPGADPETSSRSFGPGLANFDLANSRRAKGPIDSHTVSLLEQVWSTPAEFDGSHGAFNASPVIVGGVVYQQNLASDVQAIALDSGEILWERPFSSPSTGPNGLAVANGLVYGVTPTAAFALDQATGEEMWATSLTRNESEVVDMAPGYHDGVVYVSTKPALRRSGGIGTLWALDGESGRKIWRFDTVPKNLWGHPRINAGGGLSEAPAFDDDGNVYFGVENPWPIPGTEELPWGSSRPGPNLYTNSVVKLDAQTGEVIWYYQLTPHSLCQWGLQGPPVLTDLGGRKLVIAAGKAGIVIALDQRTGKLVWKRRVGIHNGHDNDGLYAMKGEYERLTTPVTAYPGSFGGVPMPVSTDGSRIFVPVINQATTLIRQEKASEGGARTGELVALDAKTGAVEWKRSFPVGTFGATTVVNDVVFAPTLDSRIRAFNGRSGVELWSASLPASVVGGVGVSANTLVIPAGFAGEPAIMAYRLPTS